MNNLSRILLAVIIVSAVFLGFSLCSAIVGEILKQVAQVLLDGAETLKSISDVVMKGSVFLLVVGVVGFVGSLRRE